MPLDLKIVTPDGEAFSGSVETVVLPGSEGDFGVLPGHERFLAPLRIGEIEIRGAESTFAAVSGGFAEVSGERVVVLAEACELAHDIDHARAQAAHARATGELERLRAQTEEGHLMEIEERSLQRAIIRIQVAGKGH